MAETYVDKKFGRLNLQTGLVVANSANNINLDILGVGDSSEK